MERFDTADLQEAKGLLEALGDNAPGQHPPLTQVAHDGTQSLLEGVLACGAGVEAAAGWRHAAEAVVRGTVSRARTEARGMPPPRRTRTRGTYARDCLAPRPKARRTGRRCVGQFAGPARPPEHGRAAVSACVLPCGRTV